MMRNILKSLIEAKKKSINTTVLITVTGSLVEYTKVTELM